ncbi:MAG: alpha-2-macroglobulin family protein [Archangium sp.]
MKSVCAAFALLLAVPASAATFDEANRSWLERSYSRACDAFTEVAKADPSNREAAVKRSAACARVGKPGGEDVAKFADGKENDFARAIALHTQWERGAKSFDAMAPALEAALKDEGRRGKEARALYDGAVIRELDNNSWNFARCDKVAAAALNTSPSGDVTAAIRFRRARARLNSGQKLQEAEAELLDVGKGSSDVADDALFALGQRRENESKFVPALDLYDQISSRFSGTTSNVKSQAESNAANIRRPWLSVSVPNNELPGMKPQVALNFRNLTTAKITLKRVDPFKVADGTWPNDPSELPGEVVKTWSSDLKEPSKHAPGVLNFQLDDVGPGMFSLSVQSGSQTSRAWALVTQLSVVTKTDFKRALVAVFDVETGQAQPDAEVIIFEHRNDGQHKRQLGRTDANGLTSFKYEKNDDSKLVFVRKGNQLTWAGADGSWWNAYNRENLAYVLVDRPLFKPGETVGLKLFLRTREGGPSTPVPNKKATVRVYDPNGKDVIKKELVTNRFGTAHFTLPLPKNTTLGQYRVAVEGDGEYWQQPQLDFRVEEYKAPEYLVSVEPLGQPKPGEVVRFKVKASYYSGGPVANANGRALVSVRSWSHSFGAWPDDPTDADPYGGYGYDDDTYSYRRYRGRGYSGDIAQHTVQFKTGTDGTAEVEVPASPAVAQGLEYAVQVLVTDSSRREISGTGSIKLSPWPMYVDVKTSHLIYRPGERVTVSLRAEDANGRPVDGDVVVKLMRLDDKGAANRVTEVRTKLSKGFGRTVLDADVVGRARVDVLDATATDERVLATTELWLTSDSKPVVPGPGFQLLVDTAPLKVGEPLRVLVAGNRAGGHALITLESETIAFEQMVELKGRARFVEIKVPADVSPNGWLSAVRVEDLSVQQQMIPIRVRGSEVEFPVSVDFGRASSEPGSSVTATIKANGPEGLASETALTVVDESIFAISPEKTDFLTFFGRIRRNHAVRTQTSQNYRAHRPRPAPKQPEANAQNKDMPSGGLAQAAPSTPAPEAVARRARDMDDESSRSEEKSKKSAESEGPADKKSGAVEAPVKMRTDFSTSAGWFPELDSKLGATLTQSVKLKDSLTSWKAVATVVTEKANVGQGATKLKTNKPLMVRLQAPRFFIEGDEVVISALVESHLPKTADVEVTISAQGFKELSPGKVNVRVEPEQVVRVDTKFKVVALGDRQIRATIRSGSSTDGMQWTLPAFVHGSAQRQFFSGRVKDTQTFEFELPEKRKPALTQLELSLSPTLLSVMFDGLPYLAQYPYGCVEQTLSRVVPATIARRAVKDLNLPPTRVPANLDDMTQKGLERLYGFQHSDGGWGWWQTDNTNLWMTAYVVSSLSLAKSAGLDVRAKVVTRGREYLTKNLGSSLDSPETHAYAVYALASTGGAPRAALDTVYARRTQLTPRARAQLALALLHQRDARARVAVENLDDVVKAAQSRADAAVGDANDAWSTSAAIEATAFTLMAYARYDLKSPLIAPLTDFLVLRRNGGKWRNTRDTAFAIYALADLARRENAGARNGTFVISVNGKEVRRVPYTRGGLELTTPVLLDDAAFKAGKNVVTVSHDGGGATGYFGAQVDVFNMNDFIRGVGGDVKVKRTYTMLGKPSTDQKLPIGAEYGMPVESGVRVRVDLEITANKAVEFVMLEDLKPAGFEAVQLTSGPAVCNYACAHAELRTDRVAMFLQAIPVGVTKLSYELRAEVPGRFAALPARFEAMYAPELQATADEMRFEVRDPPAPNAAK